MQVHLAIPVMGRTLALLGEDNDTQSLTEVLLCARGK